MSCPLAVLCIEHSGIGVSCQWCSLKQIFSLLLLESCCQVGSETTVLAEYTKDFVKLILFALEVYPKGSSNSADGYMSIFFCLAPGPHDDALEWPFANRTIKLSVVDQQSNILGQMNENKNYLTASDMDQWRRPVSVRKQISFL